VTYIYGYAAPRLTLKQEVNLMKSLKMAVVALLVMIGVLSSFGVADSAEQKLAGKTLTVIWNRWVGDYNDSVAEASKDFERATGCKVENVFVSPLELGARLYTAIEANSLPDMAVVWAGQYVPMFQAMGVLEPVSDVVQELQAEYGDFYESMFPMVTFEGENYAVPWLVIPDGLHVRKDRLAAAGLSLPESWEDVLTVAKKTTMPGKKIYGFGQGLSGTDADADKWFRTMLWSYGGGMQSIDGKTITLVSPAAFEVLDWVQEGLDAKIFPPDAAQWTSSGNNKSWASGEAVMIYNASSTLWVMRKKDPDMLAKTVMIAPVKGPVDTLCCLDEMCLAVFKSSKNKEAIKTFIKFLLERERYSKIVMPIAQPVIESFATDPKWDDPLNRPFLNAVPATRPLGYPGPVTPAVCEIYNRKILADGLASMVVYGRSQKKVLEDLTLAVKAIFARWE